MPAIPTHPSYATATYGKKRGITVEALKQSVSKTMAQQNQVIPPRRKEINARDLDTAIKKAKAMATSTPAAKRDREEDEESQDDVEYLGDSTAEAALTWHVHAWTEEMPKKYFSPASFGDLDTLLSDAVEALAKGNGLPKAARSYSFTYDPVDRKGILTLGDPEYMQVYKTLIESLSTSFRGTETIYRAWKPEPAYKIPRKEKLLLRIYEYNKKSFTNKDIVTYVQRKYMDLNNISLDDWQPIVYWVNGEQRTAIYRSESPGLPHVMAVEAKKDLQDALTEDRKAEAERLGTSVRDYVRNRVPWTLTGIGRDLTAEPATFNGRDLSYIPTDLLPIPFKRVKVMESDDKAAIEEEDDGNLSVQTESETVRSYTDRLFTQRGQRGGRQNFRTRGGRGRGQGAFHQRPQAEEKEDETGAEYEAKVTVPAPRGSEKARQRQRALNELQVAHIVRTLRPKVSSTIQPD